MHTGDTGMTDLLGAERVAKDDPRIEALGALDEAMSAIGLARALCLREDTRRVLLRVGRELSLAMAEIALPEPARLKTRLGIEELATLDGDIDVLTAEVRVPTAFIVPGDAPGGATLDVARAVVRRAERRVVTLANAGLADGPRLVPYLNRLSTLLFLLARADEGAAGVEHPHTVT